MHNIQDLKQAVKVFNQGGLVIFPTDTVFGIGCRIDDKRAVDRLFQIKKRSRKKAVPVLVADVAMAQKYITSLTDVVRRLMEEYWPGAVTLIVGCHKNLIYSPIRGGGNSIGLRQPDYPRLLEVIAEVGVPILGPSANFSGLPAPTKVSEIDRQLIKQVDYLMPGEPVIGQASTVVDCTVEPVKILRQGSMKIEI